jgi:hypothetical protein
LVLLLRNGAPLSSLLSLGSFLVCINATVMELQYSANNTPRILGYHRDMTLK